MVRTVRGYGLKYINFEKIIHLIILEQGCNHCGLPKCRICDEDPNSPYVSCNEIGGNPTPPPTTPPGDDNHVGDECFELCWGTKFDYRCGTSDDPHGGLGCNHCGLKNCRLCDEGQGLQWKIQLERV